jgi:maltooligosyltrehalose trehalohydrolase
LHAAGASSRGANSISGKVTAELPELQRRYAVGAEPLRDGGTHFRVWAPACKHVDVVEREATPARDSHAQAHALTREPGGYFSGLIPNLGAGQRYSLRVDGKLYPDPASRFQPEGPHGPSQIVDPSTYRWKVNGFPGAGERGQVIYELHVGTFTREGTYRALAAELGQLARLGITMLELMPLAEFPGRFGWGYDGVDLFAPSHLYGTPDELRELVDTAHGHGLAVILDVVYNHLGPDGNYLERFAPQYFSDRYPNEWGKPLNFDGEMSAPVREFFIENARYWIDEYHFDGFRLDATQSIHDASPRHVLADITRAARAVARAQQRSIYICAENEPQAAAVPRPVDDGGHGCDAVWNDDFHHTAITALTGRREAYYYDYTGSAQELISALKWGYLFQGQHYFWQKQRRGEPALDAGSHRFITYLQNHDQVANSLAGARIDKLASPALLRALTTLWLLSPTTPLFMQGQEFAASAPFLYFADHEPELAQQVRKGRREFMTQFQALHGSSTLDQLADPKDVRTFEACKLNLREREKHAETYALHADLLALRRSDPAFSAQRGDLVHGACLRERALLLRYFCEAGDRLVVLNLGSDLELSPAPEPLLAPPAGRSWRLVFASEDPKYGGMGYREPYRDGIWTLTAQSASVFVTEAT